MTVSVPDEAAAELKAAVDVVRDCLAEVDLACSRFRSDSELVGVNRRAGLGPTPIGPTLHRHLQVARQAAAETDGAVSPLLGRQLEESGYNRTLGESWSRMGVAPVASQAAPASSDLVTVSRPFQWTALELCDGEQPTVEVPSGASIDLGATSKALAADDAALAVAQELRIPVCVNLGGDLRIVGTPEGSGWMVAVSDTLGAATAQHVQVGDGGLATSSTRRRTWRVDGTSHHHVIDPFTGQCTVGRWETASVWAASCVAANAASTAALVKPDSVAWLRALGLPARLVDHSGAVTTCNQWPEEKEVAA